MAKGAIAKDNITEKMRDAFGSDFIGVQDKKVYVWADDGGERVQIAISMTCPKTEIAVEGAFTPAAPDTASIAAAQPVLSSEEEQKVINDLFAKLGF